MDPIASLPVATTHPLLKKCNDHVAAAVLAAFVLTVWGAVLPITLVMALQ